MTPLLVRKSEQAMMLASTHSPLHAHGGSCFPHSLVLFWSFLPTQLLFQAPGFSFSPGPSLDRPPHLPQSVPCKCGAMLAKRMSAHTSPGNPHAPSLPATAPSFPFSSLPMVGSRPCKAVVTKDNGPPHKEAGRALLKLAPQLHSVWLVVEGQRVRDRAGRARKSGH